MEYTNFYFTEASRVLGEYLAGITPETTVRVLALVAVYYTCGATIWLVRAVWLWSNRRTVTWVNWHGLDILGRGIIIDFPLGICMILAAMVGIFAVVPLVGAVCADLYMFFISILS